MPQARLSTSPTSMFVRATGADFLRAGSSSSAGRSGTGRAAPDFEIPELPGTTARPIELLPVKTPELPGAAARATTALAFEMLELPGAMGRADSTFPFRTPDLPGAMERATELLSFLALPVGAAPGLVAADLPAGTARPIELLPLR